MVKNVYLGFSSHGFTYWWIYIFSAHCKHVLCNTLTRAPQFPWSWIEVVCACVCLVVVCIAVGHSTVGNGIAFVIVGQVCFGQTHGRGDRIINMRNTTGDTSRARRYLFFHITRAQSGFIGVLVVRSILSKQNTMTNKTKNTTQYVLDTTIRKQTQIT
jgi:hypothetical protein